VIELAAAAPTHGRIGVIFPGHGTIAGRRRGAGSRAGGLCQCPCHASRFGSARKLAA
jgi:Rieske Fe-S protein